MNRPSAKQINPCPCCGERTLDGVGEFEICAVCGWEDDPVQSSDPNYAGGANKDSLTEARKRDYWEKSGQA